MGYYLYDHLGNTRITYTTDISDICNGGDCIDYTLQNVEDYYPYGKRLRWFAGTGSDWEKFLSTQHERDLETGFDYRGARFYDADIARFLSLDPMAADFADWSPYSYVVGNPVSLIDPDGKAPAEGDPPKWYHNAAAYFIGMGNAIASNLVGGAPGTRMDAGSTFESNETASFAESGQRMGDYASVAMGAVEQGLGFIATATGLGASPAGGVSLTLAGAGTMIMAHGANTTATAMGNLNDSGKVEMSGKNNQGSGKGRGKNKRVPDPEATGDHSVSNSRGSTTFEKNDKNPNGWQEVKRVDKTGASHGNVATPHVHEGKKVRPATDSEIPTDLSKNEK